MTEIAPSVKNQIEVNYQLQEPPLFKVIYVNDDTTPMDFVVESLIDHFEYSVDNAEQITISIHEAGSAVVAILPYEIAEQKGIEVTMSARQNNFPLQVKLEPTE
jgi:ATP-dependent Clp protease adaptor protein ClpS